MTGVTLLIDSADRTAVENLLSTGLFAGITTNPTLLARAGLTQTDLSDLYGWATAAGATLVYMQTLGLTVEEILANGRALRAIGDNVIVKIPATSAGFTAARRLAADGVPVLVTAVYHSTQALFAAAAGAHSIAPYVGRMNDNGRDGIQHTIDMHRILEPTPAHVLAASVRTADDVATLAANGIRHFTLGAELLLEMLGDELSDAAAVAFEHAAAGPSPVAGHPG